MSIKESLCEMFCDGISISDVPAGIAVSTAFEDGIGDRISFYIVQDKDTGLYRIEDDGSLVPELLAMGTKVTEGQRGRVFATILGQSSVEYNDATGELKSLPVKEDDLPVAALRFVSVLVRVGALSAMHPEIVRNTFKDDALARIKSQLGGKVQIAQDEPVSDTLGESIPDVVLFSDSAAPVAVFIAVSDLRLHEAIYLRMAADLEAKEQCSVVALFDKENSKLVSGKLRQRAHNRLDATPVYYNTESEAIARIEREFQERSRLQ